MGQKDWAFQRKEESVPEEMDNRLEALNRRMDVVNDTLTMLRDQQNHWHGERLEWIVILLILIEVVVGVIQLLSSFGYLGGKGGG